MFLIWWTILQTLSFFNWKWIKVVLYIMKNIFEVSRLTYVFIKCLGFFPATVNFVNLEIVSTKKCDFLICILSLTFTSFAWIKLSDVTIGNSTKSVILEMGMILLINGSLISMIFYKIWNFVMRKNYYKIVTDIHWIDLQVSINCLNS